VTLKEQFRLQPHMATITRPGRAIDHACCGGQHGDAGQGRASHVRDRSGLRHARRSRDRQTPHCRIRARITSSARRAAASASKPSRKNTCAESHRRPPRAPAGAIYTCPMHPEVRQVGPGSCPICGMALEPEQVSLDDAPDPELIDMTRRFWIALVLTLPVFVLEMGGHLGLMHLVPPGWSNWISLCAGDAGGAVGGRAVLRARLAVAGHAHLNMFTLIAMGTGVAWLYSVVGTLAPPVSAGVPRHARRGRGVFRGRRVITVLVLLGQVLELRARERTSGAIRALLDLAPKTARRIGRRTATKTSRSTASRSAIACGCVPARKFRSTASSPRAAAPLSTNRWSPANRCRCEGRGDQGDRRHDQPAPAAGACARKSRPRHHAGAHRRDGGQGAALARADPAPRRPVAGWFVPAVMLGGAAGFRGLGDGSGRSRASPSRWSPR
jgi:hypothetical protein